MKEGLFFVERTCEFAGIQFTKYFIEFVLMETNQLFSSDSNESGKPAAIARAGLQEANTDR